MSSAISLYIYSYVCTYQENNDEPTNASYEPLIVLELCSIIYAENPYRICTACTEQEIHVDTSVLAM